MSVREIRLAMVNEKAMKVKEQLQEKFSQVLDVDNSLLTDAEKPCVKCKDMDALIELMEEKIKHSSRKDKIKILT